MRAEVRDVVLEAAGWPTETEGQRLYELAREAATRGPCMEIGGFRDRSALYLAEGCRAAGGFPLFCLDAQREPGMADAMIQRAREAALQDCLVVLIADPATVGRLWPDDNTRLLMVHGGDGADDLVRDVRAWEHTVQRGGYLCVRLPVGSPEGTDQALGAVEAALPATRWERVERVGQLGVLRRRRSLIGVPAVEAESAPVAVNGNGNGNGHRSAAVVREGTSGRRVSLASSRHLGRSPALSGAGWSILGQDGGQSIVLGDGRILFLFSDTLVRLAGSDDGDGASEGRLGFMANTACIGSGADLRSALAGARYFTDEAGIVRELIAPTPEEAREGVRFWPEHGILVDGRVLVFYLGVFSEDVRSTWGFKNLGVGLALIDPETGACERLTRDGGWCVWPNTLDDLHLGVQLLREGDQIYHYGSTRRGTQNEAIVGRVPADRAGDPDAYEFFAGEGADWIADPAAAVSLGPCAPDFSVSYNPYVGAYTMLYVDGETKTLMLRTASAPEGPFSAPATIATLPHDPTSELIYLAFEHPQFRAEDGRVVELSYSQPRFALNSLVRLRFR